MKTVETELIRTVSGPHETQYTITEWAHKTFGKPKSLSALVEKLKEEVAELEETCESIDLRVKAGELLDLARDFSLEIADVEIMVRQVAQFLSTDLDVLVDRKMAINRFREWILNGDGTGRHK